MDDLLSRLRAAAEAVAGRARYVRIERDAIPAYAGALRLDAPVAAADPYPHLHGATREELAAFWLTLDAVNFGSGWFPTLRKREGRSGYYTVATGIRERFEKLGPWSASELARVDTAELASVLGQLPGHELMELFACSLNDLGRRLLDEHDGSFAALVDSASGSAVALVELLSRWTCFADSSSYDGLSVPFLKRAQIVAADLERAGFAKFADLSRLTIFADNLVPHVLRLDGILVYDPGLAGRIERGELIVHGSREEVEIRACALHAVELIVAARPGICAAEVDRVLWLRGGERRYKAVPRHRARCTAY